MSNPLPDRKHFYQSLETLLVLSPGSIQPDTTLQSLKGWDSLALLEFMTMASMDYGKDVEPTDLVTCDTASDLAEVLDAARSSSER